MCLHGHDPLPGKVLRLKHLHGATVLNSTNMSAEYGRSNTIFDVVVLTVDTHHTSCLKNATQQSRHQTSTIASDLSSIESYPRSRVLNGVWLLFYVKNSRSQTKTGLATRVRYEDILFVREVQCSKRQMPKHCDKTRSDSTPQQMFAGFFPSHGHAISYLRKEKNPRKTVVRTACAYMLN